MYGKKQRSTLCIVVMKSARERWPTSNINEQRWSRYTIAQEAPKHDAKTPNLRSEAKLPCTVLTSLPCLALAMSPLTLGHAVFIVLPHLPMERK